MKFQINEWISIDNIDDTAILATRFDTDVLRYRRIGAIGEVIRIDKYAGKFIYQVRIPFTVTTNQITWFTEEEMWASDIVKAEFKEIKTERGLEPFIVYRLENDPQDYFFRLNEN